MKKFFGEFKEFAVKGNVFDMAIGVVVGAAFGKIVSSFVADIITPPIGVLLDGVNFSELNLVLKEAVGDTPAVTLNYGNFIQTIVDFIIIALCLFFVVKAVNGMRKLAEARKEEEKKAEPPAPAVPSKEEVLLTEIRDLLKDQKELLKK
ncbi:MAG TPA: large-conductance mechanosensitive channel protein MscL [Oscillospiraceae bacterium]|nr:large-conductance mechanosensitive channel protein MscL [Oscillospiraceae bacterium]HPF56840.1 large-conductance mechanosensitive channel protein MscL [Clostridiales bacterium]HPK35897.1 large-conductance mechanosensitive channel protein MscL [Oscillospiraceae bacterium]HPR76468.1 large-conductance mechanosensitive channel protein MscL [Oscillospiraceae bacterium]